MFGSEPRAGNTSLSYVRGITNSFLKEADLFFMRPLRLFYLVFEQIHVQPILAIALPP